MSHAGRSPHDTGNPRRGARKDHRGTVRSDRRTMEVIDRLQKKLDALVNRFMTLEEQVQPDMPVTKPPHW